MVVCMVILRESWGECIRAFYSYLKIDIVLKAELTRTMLTIEMVMNRDWNFLWLESDSMLMIIFFNNSSIVP